MAGQRKRWDRVERPETSWRRAMAANRLRYLIVPADDSLDPKPPSELRSSAPCEVGDVILTTPALSEDRRKLRFVWKITARGPAEEPFAARLTVAPGKLAPKWSRGFS